MNKDSILAGMSTAKPHGIPESGAPEKYPEPRQRRGPELRERRVATFWGGDDALESE